MVVSVTDKRVIVISNSINKQTNNKKNKTELTSSDLGGISVRAS